MTNAAPRACEAAPAAVEEAIYALCVEDGGGSAALGAQLLGWSCIGYVEHDESSIKTLEQNIAAGVLGDLPIFRGRLRQFVRSRECHAYRPVVEAMGFVWGGWCDDNSAERVADLRSCLRDFRPRYIALEGDCDRDSTWFDLVQVALASCGYDTEWDCIPASACGAPFTGERRWIVAERSAESTAQIAVAQS